MAGRTDTGWRRVAPWAAVLAGWLAGCALQLRQPALWPAAAVAACAAVAAYALPMKLNVVVAIAAAVAVGVLSERIVALRGRAGR
jgi:uncharacterized membrane protein YjjB (DUF3815 family)